MKKEIIATGRTVEAAISNGAAELGITPERAVCEVLEQPKKGFLGFGESPAKVKISYTPGAEDSALEFIRTLLSDMELDVTADYAREPSSSGDRLINISGEAAGVLIGHHGDTLDSLQCLVNLAANRGEDEDGEGYTRISVDIENYRAKREETLRRLARNMAAKVKKYRKNVTLEPMNPYERRIIHSEVQGIEGVSTVSVGADAGRRVIIYLEELGKPTGRPLPNQDRPIMTPAAGSPQPQRRRTRRPAPKLAETGENPEAGADLAADKPQEPAEAQDMPRNDFARTQDAGETASRPRYQSDRNPVDRNQGDRNPVDRNQGDRNPGDRRSTGTASTSGGSMSGGSRRNYDNRRRGDYSRDNRMDEADKATPADRERYSRPRNFDRPRPPKKSNTEDIINKTIESYLKTELPKADLSQSEQYDEPAKPETQTEAVQPQPKPVQTSPQAEESTSQDIPQNAGDDSN